MGVKWICYIDRAKLDEGLLVVVKTMLFGSLLQFQLFLGITRMVAAKNFFANRRIS
jgi:hypothetical protein